MTACAECGDAPRAGRTMGARLALPVGADAAQIVELVIPWKRDRPAVGDVRDSARAIASGFEAASSMRLRCDDLVRGAPAETRKRSPCSTAAATAATRQRTSPREDRQPHRDRTSASPGNAVQAGATWARPGTGEQSSRVSSRACSPAPGGAPTINHSWSSPVSLNGWRKLSGSTRIASSGPTVSNSPSIRMRPIPSRRTESSAVSTWRWPVLACPGASAPAARRASWPRVAW